MEMEKREEFMTKAMDILKRNMDGIDADELYYSAKLIKSIYKEIYYYNDRFGTIPVTEKYEDDCGNEQWVPTEYNTTTENVYYLCIQFEDGRHLPIPMLAARDWDGNIEERYGVQQEIIKLGLQYCRPLRRAAIEAKLKFYKNSTLLTERGIEKKKITEKRKQYLRENPLSQELIDRVRNGLNSYLFKDDYDTDIDIDIDIAKGDAYIYEFDEVYGSSDHRVVSLFDFKSPPSPMENIVAKALQYLDNLVFPPDLRYDIRSELREGESFEKLMVLDYYYFFNSNDERYMSHIYATTLVDGKVKERFTGIVKGCDFFENYYEIATSKGWQVDVYSTQDEMISSFIQFISRNQDAVVVDSEKKAGAGYFLYHVLEIPSNINLEFTQVRKLSLDTIGKLVTSEAFK